MRSMLRALLPGAAVFAAALVTVALVGDPTLELVTSRYGIVLYGAGVLLAGFFHRSRVAAVLVALGCVELATAAAIGGADVFVSFVTLLMGLLGLLSLVRDRGVFSRAGLAQLVVGGLVGYAAYLVLRDPTRIDLFGDVQLFPTDMPVLADLPQVTLIVSVVSLATTLYGAYRWRGPVERALVWSELLLLASILPGVGVPEGAFLLMGAGLMLSVSVLETSYFMAYRDELTGLPARRALVHDLEQIGGTYTLAMVDVDHFKRFNDKHGHDVGDQVLHLVATRLAAGPGGGKAYRYGGEEFTLLYPGRVRDDALPHAEAVRAAVESTSFALRAWNRPRRRPKGGKAKKSKRKRQKKLSVTVSIGLADSTAKDADPESVLKNADKALYRAKRDGRNRVSK